MFISKYVYVYVTIPEIRCWKPQIDVRPPMLKPIIIRKAFLNAFSFDLDVRRGAMRKTCECRFILEV